MLFVMFINSVYIAGYTFDSNITLYSRKGAEEKVGFSANPVCQVQETGTITENWQAAVDPITAAVFRAPHKKQGKRFWPHGERTTVCVVLYVFFHGRCFSCKGLLDVKCEFADVGCPPIFRLLTL